MLIPFFFMLRDGGMNTSLTELLTLLEAMKRGVAGTSVDDFYYLSRAALVKDERLLDRFDQVFGEWYEGRERTMRKLVAELPDDWLALRGELDLTPEQLARARELGSLEALMEACDARDAAATAAGQLLPGLHVGTARRRARRPDCRLDDGSRYRPVRKHAHAAAPVGVLVEAPHAIEHLVGRDVVVEIDDLR